MIACGTVPCSSKAWCNANPGPGLYGIKYQNHPLCSVTYDRGVRVCVYVLYVYMLYMYIYIYICVMRNMYVALKREICV